MWQKLLWTPHKPQRNHPLELNKKKALFTWIGSMNFFIICILRTKIQKIYFNLFSKFMVLVETLLSFPIRLKHLTYIVFIYSICVYKEVNFKQCSKESFFDLFHYGTLPGCLQL